MNITHSHRQCKGNGGGRAELPHFSKLLSAEALFCWGVDLSGKFMRIRADTDSDADADSDSDSDSKTPRDIVIRKWSSRWLCIQC